MGTTKGKLAYLEATKAKLAQNLTANAIISMTITGG